MATATKTKPKAKSAAAKKRPAAVKKVTRTTKRPAPTSTKLQNSDWLVVAWVALMLAFLVVVVKVYVIG